MAGINLVKESVDKPEKGETIGFAKSTKQGGGGPQALQGLNVIDVLHKGLLDW